VHRALEHLKTGNTHGNGVFEAHSLHNLFAVVTLETDQEDGMSAKRAKADNKKDSATACSCFLNYVALLRPAADRDECEETMGILQSSCLRSRDVNNRLLTFPNRSLFRP
jgi:hypothetical protein